MATLLIDTVFRYRDQEKYLLHEFVIMPNHMHIMISPLVATLERCVQFIKGGFSFRVTKELGMKTDVWRRGYIDHRIRDVRDYLTHAAYLRANPVRRGLVSAAENYPYSSANGEFDLDPCPQGLKPGITQIA